MNALRSLTPLAFLLFLVGITPASLAGAQDRADVRPLLVSAEVALSVSPTLLTSTGHERAESDIRTAPSLLQGAVTVAVRDRRTLRPLVGAQVTIPGTGTGGLTNREGRVTISNVPVGTTTVRVQTLGYATADQTVEVVAGEAVLLEFELESQAVALDEMIVTATGEQRSREVGTSLSRVTSREIELAPARHTQDILAGRVPGATVLQNAGQPGAGGTVLLRGVNSISQGSDPIVYIDGVRVFGGDSPTHPAARQSSSPLNDINPQDIERVEVIKGAAATSLYGTEAASGVIQIFTKRGQAGAARWDASVTTGVNNIGHVGSKDDPTGQWVVQCRGPNNVSFDGRVFEDPTCPSSGSWLQNGLVQRYSLAVSGGLESVQYYLSGNVSDEQGVIYNAGGSTSGGFTGNFGFEPLEGLELNLSSSFNRRETEWVPSGNDGDSFMLNVSRGFGSNFAGAEGCENPDAVCVANGALLTADNVSQSNRFTTGLTATHRVGDRLSNRLTLGYDYNLSQMEQLRPFGYPRFPDGDMTVRDWRQSFVSIDYAGTYHHQFMDGDVASSFSWGGQIFSDDARTVTVNAFEFSGPGTPTLTSAARRDLTQDSRLRVTNAGFFVQETLAWRDLLFVTAGVRVDGNSAFGRDFGLQAYPKLMASYVISDSDFWPTEWWETMRLRGAVGESGKAPGAFDAVQTWNPIAGLDAQPGFTPGQLGNPTLGPERSREYEAGFEAGLFQGRVGVDFTAYTQETFDALIPVRFPPSQGFLSTQLENVGTLKNWGFETRVNFDVLRRSNLDWRARVDFVTTGSEAVDLGGEVITVQTFGRTYIREGYPVPAIFGEKVMNPDELADPVLEQDAFIGSLYPTRSISLSTDITFRNNLLLDIQGEGNFGGHMVNGNAYQNARRGAWFPCYEIQRKDLESRGPNPSALDDVRALDRVRCALNDSEARPTYDAWIESTDFFRLRSVSLTYQLPDGWIPGAERASLQVAGRNLWTWTDYQGSDPELDDYRGSLARRDYYVLPTYRTFMATLRMSF
jgi:TonB-dependent starch-binding outer membrane protein SusC